MRCPGIAWPGHPRPSFGGARGGLRFVRLVPLVPTDGTCGCLTWSRGWLLCCSEPSSRDDPNGSWRMSRVVGCVITTFLVVQHPIFAEKLTDSKMTERRDRTQVDSMRCGRTNHYVRHSPSHQAHFKKNRYVCTADLSKRTFYFTKSLRVFHS